MSKFVLIIIGLVLSNATETPLYVDRVEDGVAVIEVNHREELKYPEIPAEDFNYPISEGNQIFADKISGKFHGDLELTNWKGIEEICYQFKSYDDSVWWLLTAEELGFVPKENTTYTLVYYDNGTEEGNKPCDCLPEYECECHLYDDIFLGIFEEGIKK